MVPSAERPPVVWPDADSMRPAPYTVQQVRRETHDTFSLLLHPAGTTAIAPFQPGQFNMLYAFGVGEAAISISADPSDPGRLWHTIRQAGIVTGALARLKKGGVIGVRGPFGSPWPLARAEGRDLLIIAGGIGLAPLRPVIHHAIAHRKQYGQINILYGARTPMDILYRRQLERWRGRLDLNVEVTVDRGSPDWRGDVGVVTELIRMATFDPANAVAMICGPEIMMRFTVRELAIREIPDRDIYVSMERNMKCAVGFCGHCQYGPTFVCKDGPVFSYDRIRSLMSIREL
jgi:NAD(P)H-flavin reductase